MSDLGLMTRMARKFKWRGLKGAKRNEDGVSAMEFALIAPFMILLYFGGVELSLLMQADRRVTTATSTMGDITARSTIVRNGDMNDIFGSTRVALQPLDSNKARLRISSLVADNAGTVTVDWGDGQNTSPRSPGSSVDGLPAGVVPPGGSVIMAEIEFDYESELGYFLQGQRTLNETFYLRPRRVNQITRDRGDDDD